MRLGEKRKGRGWCIMRANCAAYSARDLSSDQAMSSYRRIDLSDINLAAYNMRPAKHDQ